MKCFLPFVLIILLNACSDSMNGKPTPQNLIPRDTLVMVLKDMTLIESHIQTKYLHVSRFQKTMNMSGKKILDHYSISHKRFEESMEYYGSRQEVMQSIYAQILDSLNKEASLLSNDVVLIDSNILQNQPIRIRPFLGKDKN